MTQILFIPTCKGVELFFFEVLCLLLLTLTYNEFSSTLLSAERNLKIGAFSDFEIFCNVRVVKRGRKVNDNKELPLFVIHRSVFLICITRLVKCIVSSQ